MGLVGRHRARSAPLSDPMRKPPSGLRTSKLLQTQRLHVVLEIRCQKLAASASAAKGAQLHFTPPLTSWLAGGGPREGPELTRRHGHGPTSEGDVLQADLKLAERRRGPLVQRPDIRDLVDQPQLHKANAAPQYAPPLKKRIASPAGTLPEDGPGDYGPRRGGQAPRGCHAAAADRRGPGRTAAECAVTPRRPRTGWSRS
jgi:hypothetical protein